MKVRNFVVLYQPESSKGQLVRFVEAFTTCAVYPEQAARACYLNRPGCTVVTVVLSQKPDPKYAYSELMGEG